MRIILASFVLVSTTLVPSAAAQTLFEPPQVVPLQFPSVFLTNPEIGDLDQDGDLDVVYTTGSGPGGFIETYVNDGSGVLTQGPVKQGFPGAQAAELHDMNGDGLPDYLLSTGDVFVLHGDGEGLFDPAAFIDVNFGANHLAAADVNGDTIPDIVLTTAIVPLFLFPATLQVWVGDGTNFTLLHSQTLAGTPTDLDVADVDGDGQLDAVVTRLDAATWHPGLASGAFGGATAIGGTVAASLVAVGDLDDDGDADVVLGGTAPQVQTLVNDGAGAFSVGATLSAGSGGASPALADIDSDGVQDLVLDDTGSGGVGQLVIWRGLGGGAFEEDVHVTAGGLPGGGQLLVADLDGDARPDVYAFDRIGSFDGASAVYLNRTYAAGSPFLDLGFALPGSNGYPVQIASGALTGGTPFSFRLLNGLPGAPVTLVLGISAAFIPHKGGVMVPSPDFLYPFVMNGAGAFTLAGTWPNGIPSGATGYLQWWFKDAAGPTPKASTSGLRFTSP